jgi:hypothetical protein
MVDRDIKTSAGLRVKKAIKTIAFHRTLLWRCR